METVVSKIVHDFSRPVEADFIVSLKAKSGSFDLFFEAFCRKNGKGYLRHTADIREAMRFSKFKAFDIADVMQEYRLVGRVERVSPDCAVREVVERNQGGSEGTAVAASQAID